MMAFKMTALVSLGSTSFVLIVSAEAAEAQQWQPQPPQPSQPCICLFDIDRTLTGKQGSGKSCPRNQVYPHIHDPAYGGGNLSLAVGALELHTTFCRYCFTGVVSAGEGGGAKMQEKLLEFINMNKRPSLQTRAHWSTWNRKSWHTWHTGNVSSLLVIGVPGREKHLASARIMAYLRRRQVAVPASNVFFFDDKAENVKSFNGGRETSTQISCSSRDPRHPELGFCGTTPEEINMAFHRRSNRMKICQRHTSRRRRTTPPPRRTTPIATTTPPPNHTTSHPQAQHTTTKHREDSHKTTTPCGQHPVVHKTTHQPHAPPQRPTTRRRHHVKVETPQMTDVFFV